MGHAIPDQRDVEQSVTTTVDLLAAGWRVRRIGEGGRDVRKQARKIRNMTSIDAAFLFGSAFRAEGTVLPLKWRHSE